MKTHSLQVKPDGSAVVDGMVDISTSPLTGKNLVILVPGTETATIWSFVARQLRAEGFDVLPLQLVGFTTHPRDLRRVLHETIVDSLVRDIQRATAHLPERPKAVIVGTSYGGPLAVSLAANFDVQAAVDLRGVATLAPIFEHQHPMAGFGIRSDVGFAICKSLSLLFAYVLPLWMQRFSLSWFDARKRKIGFSETEECTAELLLYPWLPISFLLGALVKGSRVGAKALRENRFAGKLLVVHGGKDVLSGMIPTELLSAAAQAGKLYRMNGRDVTVLERSGHHLPLCWDRAQLLQVLLQFAGDICA